MELTRRTHHHIFAVVILSLSLAMLSACGGGGGGNGGSGKTTTISGTALVPGGVVAQLNNQTFLYALNEFLFPSAVAAVTGLEPVQGALVELIEVNDAGVQVGSVLATSSTSITGDYQLDLPAGVNLKANLVVRISGTSVELRAMVVETKVDITPLSEFILRKFIDSGSPLSTLSVSDVVTLSGHAADFDVAATSDLTSMIAALESQLGPFVDDEIVAISSTPGTASAMAGDYHLGSYQMGFRYTNDALASRIEGEQKTRAGEGLFTLTDDGADNFGIIDGGSNNAKANQLTSDNLNYTVWYGLGVSQGGGVASNVGKVDSGGNFYISFPFYESINAGDTYGYRTPPTSLNVYASGVAGVHFYTGVNPEAIYRSIDTNADGVKDAVDPAAYVGHQNNFELGVIAPQAVGMTQSALAGDYGTVYMFNYFLNSGVSGTVVGITDDTIDASGVSAESTRDGVDISRIPSTTTPGAVTFSEVADNTPKSGNLTVDGVGQITATEDGSSLIEDGFVSSNGEFVILSASDSQGATPAFTSAGSGQGLAVRKPTSGAPDLSGRTYRLMGIEKKVRASGQIRFQRIRGDDDRLIFSGDGSQVSVSHNGLDVIKRAVDSVDFTTATVADSGTIDHAVTIATDGAIRFTETVAGASGHTREWKGYVSASSNIIILCTIERANDLSRYAQGMYVAIPLN